MKKSLKRLPMLTLLSALILMSASGCKTLPQHIPNPKAVYYAPPEGIDIEKGGILFRSDAGQLRRITGPMVIPSGWRITGPKE